MAISGDINLPKHPQQEKQQRDKATSNVKSNRLQQEAGKAESIVKSRSDSVLSNSSTVILPAGNHDDSEYKEYLDFCLENLGVHPGLEIANCVDSPKKFKYQMISARVKELGIEHLINRQPGKFSKDIPDKFFNGKQDDYLEALAASLAAYSEKIKNTKSSSSKDVKDAINFLELFTLYTRGTYAQQAYDGSFENEDSSESEELTQSKDISCLDLLFRCKDLFLGIKDLAKDIGELVQIADDHKKLISTTVNGLEKLHQDVGLPRKERKETNPSIPAQIDSLLKNINEIFSEYLSENEQIAFEEKVDQAKKILQNYSKKLTKHKTQ